MSGEELARIIKRCFEVNCKNRKKRYSGISKWKDWECKIIEAANELLPSDERIKL